MYFSFYERYWTKYITRRTSVYCNFLSKGNEAFEIRCSNFFASVIHVTWSNLILFRFTSNARSDFNKLSLIVLPYHCHFLYLPCCLNLLNGCQQTLRSTGYHSGFMFWRSYFDLSTAVYHDKVFHCCPRFLCGMLGSCLKMNHKRFISYFLN